MQTKIMQTKAPYMSAIMINLEDSLYDTSSQLSLITIPVTTPTKTRVLTYIGVGLAKIIGFILPWHH